MESILNDLRYGFRLMLKEPLFTITAILALTIGIGANTAIFSMVNGILLRPLPYQQSQQLCIVREVVPMMGRMRGSWPANPRTFDTWRRENHSFNGMAVVEPFSVDYTSTGEPRQIDGARASANIFDLLGVPPQLGRTFLPQEDSPGRDHVIILTDPFWRNEFHADPSILGKSLTLNGAPYEVIGVLPRSFRFPKGEQLGQRVKFGSKLDFFKPLGMNLASGGPLGNFRFVAIGRLKPGVTIRQALADMNVLQAEIAGQVGHMAGHKIQLFAELTPFESEVVGPSRRGLLLLLASVGAVLLIVCVNLASLLLARVPRRMREAAIRSSIGASRGRLMTQMVVEAFPLSIIAGVFGVAFADAALHWLTRAAPVDLPRLDEVRLDARVFWFAFGYPFSREYSLACCRRGVALTLINSNC
jgi:putative ABC transport system permease protein